MTVRDAAPARPSERRSRPRRRAAFTLIEVLIVLAIILALGGVVAYNLMPRREEAIIQTQEVQLRVFEDALEGFYFDFERYPTEEEGLAVLWDEERLEDEEEIDKWTGPYLTDEKVEDHWGNEWNYRYPGEFDEDKYEIWSDGKDGEEGTEDDIKSWSDDEDDFGGDFGGLEGGGGG